MQRTDTLIIGAGQAGLATSRLLTDAGRDHLVIDRGRLAERWRSERWDSLRLLTPNWMTRLPGHCYQGIDPEGFMTAGELVEYFEDYARSFGAPVQGETTVERVRRYGDGYLIDTDQGPIRSTNVVICTGHADVPRIPRVATGLGASTYQLTPTAYRNPRQLPDGGVLVVGASASGVQIAEELRRAGRDVAVAVGHHRRVPRRYRGLDIMWWLQVIGAHAKTRDPDVPAEPEPSVQLVGRPSGGDLDLATLADAGVRLAGRLVAVDGTRVTFADDLPATTIAAAAGLARLRRRIDDYVAANGLAREVLEPEPVRPVPVHGAPRAIDLASTGIRSVVWATGFGRRYDWLDVPVRDVRGELVHRRGVTPAPGLYAVGLWFQHRRDSSFIDGVRHDAKHVVGHLVRRGDCATAA